MNNTFFLFESIGEKGMIVKFVWFQNVHENVYNLAFGDFKDGGFDDEVVTNNNDTLKVLTTIVKSVYDFVQNYPGVEIRIVSVDKRRAKLYNYVFRNRYNDWGANFDLFGVTEEDLPEAYTPENFYHKFVLKHKH